MASATGTAVIDFGAIPGTNFVTVAVTGQATISITSHVEAFLMGDSTAEHNVTEHLIVPIVLRCDTPIAGTGFTIYASTKFRLTGTFKVRWVWAD